MLTNAPFSCPSVDNRQAYSHLLYSAPFVCLGENKGTSYLIQNVPQRKMLLLTMKVTDAFEALK